MKKITLLFAFFSVNFLLGQSIISVTPNNANRGQNIQVTITAQDVNFSVTSETNEASLIDQYSNIIPGTIYSTTSSTQAVFSFSIPGYAVPGLYSVNVFDPEGSFNMTLPDSFTVNNSFTYTIQGNIRYDYNNDGCDTSDSNAKNVRLNYTNGSSSGNIYTNNSGFYSFYDVQIGNNSFSPVLENPSYFTVSPPSASVNISPTNSTYTQDFCITPNGTHNDLEVSILPYGPAQPGFDCDYIIVYKNKGNQPQSGTINFDFYDPILDFISATPTISSQSTGMLNWNFSNLLPFETRQILVTLNLNSPMETPPVNAGNLLSYTATINGATDENPDDNTSQLTQTVVGSYDPNDKTCVEGTFLPLFNLDKYLHYVIRFENTGTANAVNIVVRDLIDTSKFDINTFVPLNASHPFVTRIVNTNLIEFIFENIQLPFDDANNDGFVAFKIKPKTTLVENDVVSNTADIYFDYNFPITTNTYNTVVFQPLNTPSYSLNNAVTIFPIPVKNTLNIELKTEVAIQKTTIYNTLGQLILSNNNAARAIDVSSLKTGSYIVKITTDKGAINTKFIKE